MWGDTAMSAPQLLQGGKVDYLVCDYLAELTLAIMASQKMKNPEAGFATDFVKTMGLLLPEILSRKVKVVVNAGGLNVEACRKALLKVAEAKKLEVKVGVVLGDDLMQCVDDIQSNGTKEMFTGAPFPPMVVSANAYLGAFPIAEALRSGCDIVVTGRVVDSALVLGPLIHEFGWGPNDLDKLSQGTLAGHLVECGAQGTGGLFTDWTAVESWVNIGFPIVDVLPTGDFTLTKPPATDGLVCPAAAAEQLLYEIHDPGAYHVPDVACDWTQVKLEQVDSDTVRVTGARGQPPTDTYKCIATHPSGFKFVCAGTVFGHDARGKAQRIGHTLLARWRHILQQAKHPDFTDTRIEVLGGDLEVSFRVSVKHLNRKALEPLVRECATASVSMAQGGLVAPGTVSPVVSAFCFLRKKSQVPASVDIGQGPAACSVHTEGGFTASASTRVQAVAAAAPSGPTAKTKLRHLCWARSGDKGDAANIGLIARRPEYLPFLRYAVTPERVRMFFQPDCKGKVERFDLPGIAAMNFLLHNTLGGGGSTSLHVDPLAKAYGQRLLEMEVDAPAEWAFGAAKL
eukprot:TRINITY_DN29449_c0_g1_i1.p1 TRINITY_DN29449_c0_g1~~TRINITY_DN29449_c0_g1_i1.p1  ORF type:complete len:590 (+),score=124.17 TRINITY_DN29449_c0_g1_i1:62-1771(+)